MDNDGISAFIARIDRERMSANLFYLAQDPLPFRKLNYTVPGHEKNTLYEADDFITAQLESCGYEVEAEPVQVQAYRRDISKPLSSQYSVPQPEDPWYTACNLYAKKPGTSHPDEIIVVVSHKDSQSWVDSPGASDNAIGTVGNMEIARVLADCETSRSIWFLYCNEEHSPWTSVTAAEGAKERGDNIIAVFNIDSVGGKSDEMVAAGRLTNVTLYTTPEGKALADLQSAVIKTYDIPLEQKVVERPAPGDDDGSFVKAGFPAAIMNLGSYPYAHRHYHAETDVPEGVDMENAALAIQASLAAILTVDREGL